MKFDSPDAVEILPVGEEHLESLASLAVVIWRQYYPSIISWAQIDYMLAGMYAPETLRADLAHREIRFFRLLVAGRFVGFASLGPASAAQVMKLHKLYLLPEFHGRGLGRRLLQYCEAEACRLGARRLLLCVNKRNLRALQVYQQSGFIIAESITVDIGGGFVMDDFLMTKDLPTVADPTPQ
ncbi:MAG: GNAT family N-acetyltransferase [Verrucomicrobiota bacterium]